MALKKTENKKFLMDLYAFLEWTNQLTYLVFFTAILLSLLMLMNYFMLVQIVPSMQNSYSLPALITALIAFGIVLIFSVQRKRVAFETQLKKDMK
ncbi:MAG: hypothetical protein Q7R70_05160 [Candidatus Diapherotrites archaeon]|nr:hypothetical protein [Candidatus Diapherotrites archaeon]